MIIKNLGLSDYQVTLKKMQYFTANRNEQTTNELWITQHNSVFTHGISSSDKHMLVKNSIPIIKTDRGGQITYHDTGQIIIYLLLDLKKLKIGVKKLVNNIEKSIIILLKNYQINACKKKDAPGVYVESKKIAALGLKIKNANTYHGLSLNVNMNLTPFDYINPCGYNDLKVCKMQDFVAEKLVIKDIELELCTILKTQLGKP